MAAEVVECGAVAAAAASSTTAMPAEAVDAVEATEADEPSRSWSDLYAQLPSMEEKGAALWRAPAPLPRWTAWRRRRPTGGRARPGRRAGGRGRGLRA